MAAEILIEIDPFPQGKGMRYRKSGLVQTLDLLHKQFHVLLAVWIRVAGTLVVAGNFIASFPVKINNILRHMERIDRLIYSLLLLPVNKMFCSRTWNPADVVVSVQLKQKRLVCHACLQTADICNISFRNAEHFGNQAHSLIVRVILVFRIKETKLLQIFKFIDLMLRLRIGVQLQISEMVNRCVFPVELFCARPVIVLIYNRKKLL